MSYFNFQLQHRVILQNGGSYVYNVLQTVDDARLLMRHIDPELGRPLPEKDYGGNCRIYDHENPADPFHNFKVQLVNCTQFYFSSEHVGSDLVHLYALNLTYFYCLTSSISIIYLFSLNGFVNCYV